MKEISQYQKMEKLISALKPKNSNKSIRFKSFHISRNSTSFPHRASLILNAKTDFEEKHKPIKTINPKTLVYDPPFLKKNKDYNGLCDELKNLEIQDKMHFNFKNDFLDLDEELDYTNTKKNWIINDSGYDFNNIADILYIVEKVKINPEKRKMKDVLEIVKFLTSTKLGKEFKEGFEQKDIFEKLITFCGVEIRYKFFKKGETIFRIGDLPDFFYIILLGKVDILKPLPKTVSLTGNQYFSYLMNLKKSKDEHLFDLCIKANIKTHYRIDSDDVEVLKYIYIYIVLEQINRKKKINFREALNLVDMSYKELDLNKEQLSDLNYIIENMKKIKLKIPDISTTTISKYLFLRDISIKRDTTIYYYSSFLTLDSKSHFGDSAMDSNTTRNATITAAEDTHTAYISCNSYFHNVVVEKVAIIDKKVEFLHSNFIFKRVNQKRFEQKYYGLFIRNHYKKGDIIYKEGTNPSNVYFIEEGNVELYSSKNIYELEKVIEYLEEKRKNFMKNKGDNEYKEQDIILTYSKINYEVNDLRNDIIKKNRNKIFLLKDNEDLGLLSFYFGYPYLATCIVTSASAKIYQIDNKYLSDMILKEPIIYRTLINRIEEKLSLFHERLFNINNTKLLLADHQKNIDKKSESKNAIQNKDSSTFIINSNKSKRNKDREDNNNNKKNNSSKNLNNTKKNYFNKTMSKINYNKIKQIFNKIHHSNLTKSINVNNNSNINNIIPYNKSKLPSLNFQKALKITDNISTDKTHSFKPKNLYSNEDAITTNISLQISKNNQKNILMKKNNIFKNSSVVNYLTLKRNKKEINLSNILFKNKSTTFIEEKKFCIDPVLRRSYEAYEEMNKSKYRRIYIQKNKNRNKITENSLKKGDSIEDQKIKTQSMFYKNNHKSKIRQHLNNIKPYKNNNKANISLSCKSMSYSKNYINAQNNSNDEEMNKKNNNNDNKNIKINKATFTKHNKFINYNNAADALKQKIKNNNNKINHPYFSPLVLLKKEQYKIFKDDRGLKNNIKQIKEIKNTINKKKEFYHLGYFFKFINKYNPYKNSE